MMSKNVSDVISNLFNTKWENIEFEFLSEFTILWGIFESRFREKEKSLNFERIEKVINSNEFKYIRNDLKSFNSLPEVILINLSDDNVFISFSPSPIDFQISLFPTEIKYGLNIMTKHFGKNHQHIEKSDSKIILLLSFIAFRLRNNLFHGNKVSYELYQQQHLFEIINVFLSEVLIKTKNIVLTQ